MRCRIGKRIVPTVHRTNQHQVHAKARLIYVAVLNCFIEREDVEHESGRCGMAGIGFEHVPILSDPTSEGLYEMSPHLGSAVRIMADWTACRRRVNDGSGRAAQSSTTTLSLPDCLAA